MSAITVRELRKVFRFRARESGLGAAIRQVFRPRYQSVEALEGLTFAISPGERVAFVGPNGAGKSTTLKILSGILHPSSGEVRVLGLVPGTERERLAYRIGTVFGQRSQLWYHLPAGDTLDLLATIYDMPRDVYRRERDELVETFAIGNLLRKPVRQLSLGERMRCEIAASLLHRPDLLFLDEPTIGLDVTAKAIIRDLLKQRAERHGTTLLLTSHDTGDMERVCDRVLVIHKGKLLLDQTIGQLRSRYIRRKRITLLTVEPDVKLYLPGVRSIEAEPHRLVLEVDLSLSPVEKVVEAAMKASPLRDLNVEDPPMEEIVKEIYASA